MKAIYPAIDGVKYDANETLAALAEGLSAYPDNLLSDPNKASAWTAGNGGVLSQQSSGVITLTNGSAAAGYSYRAVTTVANTYYLIRAYAANPNADADCRLFAGTSAGGSTLGTSADSTTSKVNELIFKASGTATYVHLQNNAATSGLVSYWSKIEVIALDHVGVDETTELQTNGTFTSNTTGWNVYSDSGTGVISSVAEQLLVDNNSSATYVRAVQGITTVIGVAYKFSVDVIAADAGASGAQLRATNDSNGGSGSGVLTLVNGGAGDTIELNFVATSTTTYISLMVVSATTTHTATFDNARVSRSGNIISNGSFGFDYGWTLGTGWTISGGVATHAAGTASTLTQTINPTAGTSYVVTFDITARTAGTMSWNLGGQEFITAQNMPVGSYSYTVVAGATNNDIVAYSTSTGDHAIDNVTVRLAVVDSSANGDGLEVHGEIVKVPVNYNSDTLAYANFSAYNYLKQPYSANLDPGTGDLSASLLFKSDGSGGTEYLIQRDSVVTAQRYGLHLDSSGYVNALIDDNTTVRSSSSSTTAVDDTAWHYAVLVYDASAGAVYLYLDGYLIDSTAGAVLNTLTNTSAVFAVGLHPALSGVFGGYIANIKIDIGNAWTAQKILTDYNSEAVLFKPNELFSVVGTNITLSCGAREGGYEDAVNYSFNEAVDGSREYMTRNTKQTFSVVTTPYSDLRAFRKFQRSTATQSFTIDQRAYEYDEDNPLTVYRVSKGEKADRAGFGVYTMAFTVRER